VPYRGNVRGSRWSRGEPRGAEAEPRRPVASRGFNRATPCIPEVRHERDRVLSDISSVSVPTSNFFCVGKRKLTARS
jgi:hypothetical protein